MCTGEFFNVFGHAEKELVHVTLPFATNDTPARLAMGGFYSQNSDTFMCYCCEAPFCSLVDPVCFDRESNLLQNFNL